MVYIYLDLHILIHSTPITENIKNPPAYSGNYVKRGRGFTGVVGVI